MPHIPLSDTDTIPVLSFREALETVTADDYDRNRWLYVPDAYDEYRYILGTRGEKPLICIGINPSTARPDALDNTLKSVERVALANGYDSFLMMNVYAQRATDPKHMEKAENPFLRQENLEAFRYVLSLAGEKPAVWAAWGTIVKARPYLIGCMMDFVRIGEAHNAVWYTAGARSKNGGHPHHPLYLRKDAPLDPFDPIPYINALQINQK
ncbi:MAG: DUF1643 domain-containing protein [Ruminococcaceae bacterium]|nr:DUF1643 domain-containing protein [Oscillospiraceae bacterium]